MIREHYREWADKISSILQNQLLNEGALIRFARDRGLPISGIHTGDLGRFLDIGWIEADPSPREGPYFHPFRVYPLHLILQACHLHIAPSTSINQKSLDTLLSEVFAHPAIEKIRERANLAAELADLAILMEPLFWPIITSRVTWSGLMENDQFEQLVGEHRARVTAFLHRLDPAEWKTRHERLRLEAANLDDNGDLYLLLRLSPWLKRERLKGRISGALWFRHMGEVIRRGFEQTHDVRWPEEDESHGEWFPGARERIYGSARPLDDPLGTRPHLAFEFGLHTGSTVRWYVEGDTEYHAALAVLPRAAAAGIELVNLKGAVGEERANAALRLADALAQDRKLRRFSFISFDADVAANLRAMRRQIQEGKVVGYVNANQPDFEFGNFGLNELVEVAARLEESQKADGDVLRKGDWRGTANARAFEERFCSLSTRRPPALKGEEWGVALGQFAIENPRAPWDDRLRPFVETVQMVLRARSVRYEIHRDRCAIDPKSFQLVNRPSAEEAPESHGEVTGLDT